MKFKEYKGLDLPGLAADVLKEWDAQASYIIFLFLKTFVQLIQ